MRRQSPASLQPLSASTKDLPAVIVPGATAFQRAVSAKSVSFHASLQVDAGVAVSGLLSTK